MYVFVCVYKRVCMYVLVCMCMYVFVCVLLCVSVRKDWRSPAVDRATTEAASVGFCSSERIPSCCYSVIYQIPKEFSTCGSYHSNNS